MKTCPKCGLAHSKSGKFCTRTCANSRGPRTDEFKEKVSSKLKGRKGHNKTKGAFFVERITKKCPSCSTEFLTTVKRNKKYCSEFCRRKESGGYRPHSGRSYSGYYKGIYCGSTYELCWVIYNLDHSVKFTRFTKKIELNGVTYYPDFLLEDEKTIVEIKGYESQDLVDKKTKVAEAHGYNVIVLRKKELEPAFIYVKNKYGTSNYRMLYDGYKSKYEYRCDECGLIFSTDIKRKTETKFCSKTCSCKFTQRKSRQNKAAKDFEIGNYKRQFDKETALEIYHSNDKTLQQLADEYKTTKNVIWFIKSKRSYKWIHD